MTVLVLGVGNPDAGDDAAGREAARRLAARLAAGAASGMEVREHSGSAFEILDAWRDHERVVLIDACRGGAPAGTLHRFDAAAAPLPADLAASSTHGYGPAQAIELARALGRLPGELTVYAIEGGTFEGPTLSPPVEAAVDRLVGLLARV